MGKYSSETIDGGIYPLASVMGGNVARKNLTAGPKLAKPTNLGTTDEAILLNRYQRFIDLYSLYFRMLEQIFILHGTLSVLFIGLMAGINAGQRQSPEFYIAASAFYGLMSLLIVAMMFRLRSLISLYGGEMKEIEKAVRSTRRRRLIWPTSFSMFYFVLVISIITAAYTIAPARDRVKVIRPLAPVLRFLDVPLRLEGGILSLFGQSGCRED